MNDNEELRIPKVPDEDIDAALARLEAEVSDELQRKKEEEERRKREREAELLRMREELQTRIEERRRTPEYTEADIPAFSGTKSELGGRIMIGGDLYYVSRMTYEQFKDMPLSEYAKAVEMLATEVLVTHAGFNAGFFIPIGR